MQISTRGRYAVMAMVHLAGRDDCCTLPVTLADIAQAEQLSLSYLEQLFGQMRRAGLVCSARGPSGGYRLARPACRISIAQVVLAVDENLCATRCSDGPAVAGAGGCAHAGAPHQRCRTHDLWASLGGHIRSFLAGISLEDVACCRVAPPEASFADLAALADAGTEAGK